MLRVACERDLVVGAARLVVVSHGGQAVQCHLLDIEQVDGGSEGHGGWKPALYGTRRYRITAFRKAVRTPVTMRRLRPRYALARRLPGS